MVMSLPDEESEYPVLCAAELLRTARRAVADEFGTNHPMLSAVQNLIDCAVDTVVSVPSSDLDGAREGLRCARAATVTAWYVVCKMGDEVRHGTR